nr:MAG TPA: hypothetical protein [Caudoviricetes sp.]
MSCRMIDSLNNGEMMSETLLQTVSMRKKKMKKDPLSHYRDNGSVALVIFNFFLLSLK